MFLEGWGGLWFACKSTGDSTGGRAHSSLCVDDEDPHLSQPLLYQLSNTATVVESTVECKCVQLEIAIVFHFPMERFFTRRAGPPVTAWQERHAEEDVLALVRHNAAGPADDGAVATCREEEARREAELGRAVHTGLVRLGGHARGTPRDLAAGEAARLVAPRYVAIRWKECTDRWRRGCRSSGACEVEAGIPPAITRSAALGGGPRTAALLAGMGQQDDRGPPGGMAATWTLRRWLDENKEGREPRDACAAIIPILREKCDRVGEAGVPVSASVMQPTFNRVAEQHDMIRRCC